MKDIQEQQIRKRTSVSSNTKPKKKGLPKAAASSASTGGQGVSFENRAQAVKLLHMCLGAHSPGIPMGWTIVELRFQARPHGPQTDDLVCTIESSTGIRRKVFMQMKSGLMARKSTKAFEEAIGGAWIDYQQPSYFKKNEDQIVIVHDTGSSHYVKGASDVVRAARLSLSALEWLEKIEPEGVSNDVKRKALAAFRSIVNVYADRHVNDDELFDFLKHLSFISHDLKEEGTSEHIALVNQIGFTLLANGHNVNSDYIWSTLVTTCMTLNANSAGISIDSIAALLDFDLARLFKIVRDASSSNLSFSRHQIPDGQVQERLAGGIFTAASSSPTSGQEAIPAAREDSTNKLISNRLDHINAKIKEYKYQEAMSDLSNLGQDMKPFDAHQTARWYLMRGTCKWHFEHDENAAAEDFLKAADLCDDDDKLAAARVRGLLLKKDIQAAASAGQVALRRFPESLPIWVIAKNAELLQGGSISEDDIPLEHRGEADAVQIVAWHLHHVGNIDAAAIAARNALALPTANFFTRYNALEYTLLSVTSDALNMAFHLLTPADLDGLNTVAQAFEPHLDRLWHIQSNRTLFATVVNLGYVYIFLKRGEDVIALLREARARGINEPEFIRLELEAYRDTNQTSKALEIGNRNIASMPVDTLVTFAQIAANEGNLELVERALDTALTEDKEHAVEAIRTLYWDILLTQGRDVEVLEQLDTLDLSTTIFVPLLAQAARLLRRAGQLERADQTLDHVIRLVSTSNIPTEKYMVATVLLHAKRFSECATIYESIIKQNLHSELHNDLLYCYLQLGAHAKAKHLVDSFPTGWMSDYYARGMAIQLAENANDWTLLIKLSQAQLIAAPESAMSWLFRLYAASHEPTTEFLAVLAKVPDVLEGTTQEFTQIAKYEISNGFEDRGLKRIYRMRRMNLTDIEVAAAHLTAHIFSHKSLPNLDIEMPAVAPGTYFTVEDENGHTITITIDPEFISGLPEVGEFRSASRADVAPFIGAVVGQEIIINQAFSEPKHLKIKSIGSSYRRLLDSTHELLKHSITSSSYMSVINLPEDEHGNLDFSAIKDQVIKRSEMGKRIMEVYRGAPMTLGCMCRLMGCSLVDLLRGWPGSEIKLDVGGESLEQRTTALNLLARTEALYVIDAATLIELGRLDCLHLLSNIPQLHCSTKTYDLIRAGLDESKILQTAGTMVAHEGDIAFVEITDQDKLKQVDFLQGLVDAIESHCKISPAYGPLEWPQTPKELRDVVSAEEMATLTLSLELGATLFCLDARLRLLGGTLGLEGIWPQALLSSCLAAGQISRNDYTLACVKMFLSGRSFISLNSLDLLLTIYKGDAWARAIISAFQEHIAEENVDFDSALTVVFNFLVDLASAGVCQFGFFIEATSFLTEGLARHKKCPSDLAARLAIMLGLSVSFFHGKKTLDFIWLTVDRACLRAQSEKIPNTFKGKIIFGSNTPTLFNGLTEEEMAEMLMDPVIDKKLATNRAPDSKSTSSNAQNKDY